MIANQHRPLNARGAAARDQRTKAERYTVALIGAASLIGIAATVWLGLWVTPPDVNMGQLVRLVYVHPPVAWVAYLAFGLAAAASLAYLWRKTRSPFWDRVAGASAEIGVVFCTLTLISGSIWGRPTWGVWWTWDARLTSTALLLVLFLGYLALRKVPGNPETRYKRSAVAALIAFLDVPIDHFSVLWWHTLHQPPTVLTAGLTPHIHGIMAWTLLLGFCSFTLGFVWLLVQRYRVELMHQERDEESLATLLAERRAEADATVGAPARSQSPVGTRAT